MPTKHHEETDPSRGGTTGGAGGRLPRILVVEDGLIMARDIEARLKKMSYNVVGIAGSGDEAVRKAKDLSPDLVLMDVNLKGSVDGIHAAALIRGRADIPVVYVTGYSDDQTLRRARATDPFGYILKPFEERELHGTIEMALYRHQMQRQLKAREQRYRNIAELVSDFAYCLDVEVDGKLTPEWATEGFTRSTGLSNEALADLSQHVHVEDRDRVAGRIAALREGKDGVIEYRLRTGDGGYRWLRESARPLWDDSRQRVVAVVCAAQDITAQKKSEEYALSTLKERGKLLEETPRQVLLLLARMESLLEVLKEAEGDIEGADISRILASIQTCLRLHQRVYGVERFREVPVSVHLQQITGEIFKKWRITRTTFSVEADPILLSPEHTVTVMLVTHELVTNALQHAFPDGTRGEIRVSFRRDAVRGCTLQVSDTGVGLRKEIDVRRAKSVGLRWVQVLTKHLQGRLEVRRDDGTHISLTFLLA
jgi:PAS domain S-box-containing protein